MKKIEGALRLTGFDKPTVWTIMTPLAIKTESANMVLSFSCRDKDSPHGSLPISTRSSSPKPSLKVNLV